MLEKNVKALSKSLTLGTGYFRKMSVCYSFVINLCDFTLTFQCNPEICGVKNDPIKHFEQTLYLPEQLTLRNLQNPGRSPYWNLSCSRVF